MGELPTADVYITASTGDVESAFGHAAGQAMAGFRPEWKVERGILRYLCQDISRACRARVRGGGDRQLPHRGKTLIVERSEAEAWRTSRGSVGIPRSAMIFQQEEGSRPVSR